MNEINTIDKTDFKVPRLNMISDILVFCCYTGLPYTEVANLEPNSIIQGIDGEPWLDIFRQKTKKTYQVLLLPRALETLKKYEEEILMVKNWSCTNSLVLFDFQNITTPE